MVRIPDVAFHIKSDFEITEELNNFIIHLRLKNLEKQV